MPWKVNSVMEERLRFILEYEAGEESMSELCQRYGISRETGYLTLRRYRGLGLSGLQRQSHAAHRHPNQTAAEIEQKVLELRQAHMLWGPAKTKTHSAAGRAGTNLAGGQHHRRTAAARRFGGAAQEAQAQHSIQPTVGACAGMQPRMVRRLKGWFRTTDGERIDPLTISDAYSRYLLRCQTVEKTNSERVQAIFEAAFREYGMPQAIRTDNGPPFASQAVAGLSRLAVWWIKLGI